MSSHNICHKIFEYLICIFLIKMSFSQVIEVEPNRYTNILYVKKNDECTTTYPTELLYMTNSNVDYGNNSKFVYHGVANLIIYYCHSTLNGTIKQLGRSIINDMPTTIYISKTTNIGKNAKFIGFDQIIFFDEQDLSWIDDINYLSAERKQVLKSHMLQTIKKYNIHNQLL